jgi:hypothetical protein
MTVDEIYRIKERVALQASPRMSFIVHWAPLIIMFGGMVVFARLHDRLGFWVCVICGPLTFLALRPLRRRMFIGRANACGIQSNDAAEAFIYFDRLWQS